MPGSRVIPEEIERFILTRIPSVPYLEAALFFRAAPWLPRTVSEVAQALYLPPHAAAKLVQSLCDGAVVVREGTQFRYAPAQALGQALDELASVYADNLVGVTQLIHDATRKNAQRFADAFKLRKDP